MRGNRCAGKAGSLLEAAARRTSLEATWCVIIQICQRGEESINCIRRSWFKTFGKVSKSAGSSQGLGFEKRDQTPRSDLWVRRTQAARHRTHHHRIDDTRGGPSGSEVEGEVGTS